MTLSIMTLSITISAIILKYHYAQYRILFIVILNAIMLSEIMLSILAPAVSITDIKDFYSLGAWVSIHRSSYEFLKINILDGVPY
jgi:hypothetical protein